MTKAWVVTKNSDLTEGRGFEVVHAVCAKESTARRVAKGINVQGCDGHVKEVKIYKKHGFTYGPVQLVKSTKEDDQKQARMGAARAAAEKARAVGLTEDDISALRKG